MKKSNEFTDLMDQILKEGLARIDELTDEELNIK
jgi:hypothetical protein